MINVSEVILKCSRHQVVALGEEVAASRVSIQVHFFPPFFLLFFFLGVL